MPATGAAALTAVLALGACGSAPKEQPLYRPGELSAAQQKELARAEHLWRSDDPAYPALRDQLAADPVQAFWLTRLFVRDLLVAQQGLEPGVDTGVLRAAARVGDPAVVRARAQVQALGVRAMPCIAKDLLENRQEVPRRLGIDLVAAVGPDAVPTLQAMFGGSEPRVRRTITRALDGLPPGPAVLELLRRAAGDEDFGVRGEVTAGLAGGGPEEHAVLRRMLAEDREAFVRRMAAGALGRCRDPQNATALIDYLDRCKQQRDPDGEHAAQDALAAMAGSKGPRTVAAWRRWLQNWDPAAPAAATPAVPGGKRQGG